MKVRCIKESPFINYEKGKVYEIAGNGKINPEFSEYFEVVEEKDFEWYLKETLIKLRIETGIFALKLVEDSIDMFKQNTLSLIARRLLISETYRTIAEELNEGWVPDRKNKYEEKWYNYFSILENTIKQYDASRIINLNDVYFRTKEAAKKAAKIMGKYLEEL